MPFEMLSLWPTLHTQLGEGGGGSGGRWGSHLVQLTTQHHLTLTDRLGVWGFPRRQLILAMVWLSSGVDVAQMLAGWMVCMSVVSPAL